MTTDAELRATLAHHAAAVPDVEAVHAGIHRGIHRRRQRRRATTGIGVLAVMAVPVLGLRLTDGSPSEPRPAQVAGAPGASATDARLAEICKTSEEYIDASDAIDEFLTLYSYDDATALAEMWNSPCGETGAKILAGEMLLDGEALPFAPGGGAPAIAP